MVTEEKSVLRQEIPSGRVLAVRPSGWADLPGFGRPHPGQRSPLKSWHPGLCLLSEPARGNTVTLAPGSSSKGRYAQKEYFATKVKLLRDNPFEGQKESYFFPGERRSVWRNPHNFSTQPHFGDLSKAECRRLEEAVLQYGWEDYFPDV